MMWNHEDPIDNQQPVPERLKGTADAALETAVYEVAGHVVHQLAKTEGWASYGKLESLLQERAKYLIETDPEIDKLLRETIISYLRPKHEIPTT